MMYLADSAQLQELHLKGSPNGHDSVGPPRARAAARRTTELSRSTAAPWSCARWCFQHVHGIDRHVAILVTQPQGRGPESRP